MRLNSACDWTPGWLCLFKRKINHLQEQGMKASELHVKLDLVTLFAWLVD